MIAGTVATIKNDSDASKHGFTVSGFNLREYRKEKPDIYRYNNYYL